MPNEISVTRPSGMPFNDLERLGEYIAKSNLFGIKTKEQAIVLMAIAQAEGRHPVEAARDYDIVNNRPAKKAEAMLRDFIKAGGTVKWHSLTDELADATFNHPQTGEVRIDWDMKRAQTAFGKKDMYTKFPRQMLRSRVVSEGVRTLWPLATSGMYVPEEAADIPTKEHNGPTFDAEDETPVAPIRVSPPRAEAIAKQAPAYEAPQAPVQRVTLRQWLDEFEARCAAAQTQDEGDRILREEAVLRLDDLALQINEGARSRALAVRKAMVKRLWPEPPEDEAEPEPLEIIGQDKVAAG